MTGTICSVAKCKSNAIKAKASGESISFFSFPKDLELQKLWIRRCYRKDKFSVQNKRICSKHFVESDFEDALQSKLLNIAPKKLKKTAVPSINLPVEVSHAFTTKRQQRQLLKKRKEIVSELLSKELQPSLISETLDQSSLSHVNDVDGAQLLPSTSRDLTPQEQLELNLKLENEKLKKKLEENEKHFVYLNNQKLKLEEELAASEQNIKIGVSTVLKNTFAEFLTPNQLDIILNKKTRAHWTSEEISKAFTLRYFSKRAYIYVREVLKYPLPGISTLQKWASNIRLRDGILKDVLKVMESCGKIKNSMNRVTILSYDEMKVSELFEYDQQEDEVIGEHKYMQMVMARGIFENWKQPIYVGFDVKMTKTLLEEVITELHGIGYNVVGCVSDCGGSNMGLWRAANIHIENTYMLHPVTQENVYFFADAPHLLKLIRNWLIDTGFQLEDSALITIDPIIKLIEMRESEVCSFHKLTPNHVTCEGAQRQNVALAAQLFSNTTSAALKRYKPGSDPHLAENVADFVDLVHRWFELFNTYSPVGKIPTKQPYGQNLEAQNLLLDEMLHTFNSMRCRGKNTLQTFQKGVIISILSLKNLLTALKNKYECTYILTHRLNQDLLENLFSQIRTRGGLHDHPSPLNALYRLRMLLLGKNAGMVQRHTNVAISDAEDFMISTALKKAAIKLTAEIPEPSVFTFEEISDSASTSSKSSAASSSSSNLVGLAEKDGLEYVAGFVAKKYITDFPSLGQFSKDMQPINFHTYSMPSWVQSLSFGGLIKPSSDWLNTVMQMESYFKKFHKKKFNKGPKIIKRTVAFIKKKMPEVDEKLINEYVRQRLFIRIKYLNCLKKQKTIYGKRKSEHEDRKAKKKIRKIIN